MFYRYILENLTEYINAGEAAAGNDGFDYARLSDAEAEEEREGLVQEKGFFMLLSEHCFSGLFDDFDMNSNKLRSTVAKRHEPRRGSGAQY